MSLIAAALMAEAICHNPLAAELKVFAKYFVGRRQAAPDMIYEFTAAGKHRIFRDRSK